MTAAVAAALVLTVCVTAASAQSLEVDPLRCWWRTSASAVRIGEPFSVVLTCSVVETDALKVVPDQGPLEPTAVQMPPFEVLGGTHPADLRADDRRFFQYDYRLRVISEDLFGKDAKVPDLKITYRVQSQANGAAIEGIDKTYYLPALSVRVLSLVPADATDIRDATPSTFGDIEARLFRANVLVTVAGVLFALGGVLALVAVARGGARYRRQRPAAKPLATDAGVLRAVHGELARIGRERTTSGWTPSLASRLLTALRVVATYALSRSVVQMPATAEHGAQSGTLVMASGWARNRKILVSPHVTPLDISREVSLLAANGPRSEDRRSMLDDLQRALARLTAGQYGQQRSPDDWLDDALEVGSRTVRRLRISHVWPVRTFRAASRATVAFGHRVWSR